MAIKTKGYRSKTAKTFVIRAVKVSVRNLTSVKDWAVGSVAAVKIAHNGEESNHRVRVATPKGIRAAYVGDYVVKTDDGKFHVIKGDQFLDLYEAV